MPEKINLKISAGQTSLKHKRALSLGQAIGMIKNKNYPSKIEDELIKNISRRPSNTYDKFLSNIGTHIEKIRGKQDGKDQD